MNRFIVLAVALALIALGGVANASRPNDSVGRVCFSKVAWSAKDGDRPCVSIRVYEDGTYSGVVHPARFGVDHDVN